MINHREGNPIECPVPPQLNPRVAGLSPSATVAINDHSNQLKAQGRDIIKLGLGQSPFPVPESVVQALRENAHQKDYLPVLGLHALRETVAQHHRRTFGIECTADDVLVGPGSKELMFLVQLAYQGELVIPSPCWVSYAPQAKIIGRSIRRIPTSFEDEWHLTPQQLDRLCHQDPDKHRLVILNYPSNPTGRTLSVDQLQEIAEIARKHRLLVLSDEIYGKIHHDGAHQSIVPFYPEGTIMSGGLSKWCGAGGWRLGVFVFPKCLHWLLEAMAAAGSETFTSTSAPIQYAAVRAFQEGPDILEYLDRSRRILKAVAGQLVQRLQACQIEVLPCEGGFYLFPDFRHFRDPLAKQGIQTSTQLCSRILEETNVAILPGEDFGCSPDCLTARLAFVDFDGDAALKQLANLPPDSQPDADFVSHSCSRVVHAVDRICSWVKSL